MREIANLLDAAVAAPSEGPTSAPVGGRGGGWARDVARASRRRASDARGVGDPPYGSGPGPSLRDDRGGIAVSAPIELAEKTLPRLSRAAAKASTKGQKGFILPRLEGAGHGSEMEFCPSFRGGKAGYVPSGYEEFERDNDGISRNMHIFDIRDSNARISEAADAVGTESTAVLEEFAAVLEGEAQGDDEAAAPLSVKILSSSRLAEILQASGGQERGGACEATKAALLAEPSLPLPQTVGAGLSSDRPSLAAIVTEGERLPGDDAAASGDLILKFSRREVRPKGREPDPFCGRVSLTQFFIGRAFRFSLPTPSDPVSEEERRRKEEGAEFLRMAMLNSERFVPAEKQRQWDEIPDVYVSVAPYRRLPPSLAWWLLSPEFRRSKYDLSFANCLLYLESEGIITPNCLHATKSGMIPWSNDLARVHSMLLQNASGVTSEVQYFSEKLNVKAKQTGAPWIRRPSFVAGTDAADLAKQCGSIDSPSNKTKQKVSAGFLFQSCKDYVWRTLSLLEMERVRSLKDAKRHDLFSTRWERVEIAPPAEPHPGCHRCNGGGGGDFFQCAYHLASAYMERKDGGGLMKKRHKPIGIRSRDELELLAVLVLLFRPGDRLIAKLRIPGAAENFPLISMGDLVRFRFMEMGITNEIVGEVAEVVIKTEMVSVCLPPPFQEGIAVFDTYPYLQALLRTETHMVDAEALIQKQLQLQQTFAIHQIQRHLVAQSKYPFEAKAVRDEQKHTGRFDLRLSFLGGRGFDITSRVMLEAVELPDQSFKRRKKGSVVSPRDMRKNLCRVVAPTRTHCGLISSVSERYSKPEITSWIHALNQQQKTAVCDIVHCVHGRAPYIIFGPAGTGKTLTVCEAIVQVLKSNPRAKILVCAPSDAACDVLATRLLPLVRAVKGGQSLLLLNWWSRKPASLHPSLLQCTPISPEGIFFIPPKEQICAASVVVCQCFVAGCLDLADPSLSMESHFTHLFIDETSQAMECEAMVPQLKVGHSCSIILAGDPKQLGPTIREPVAASLGLGVSIQERLMQLPLYQQSQRWCVMTKLVANYRSHDALLTVPSSLFYGGNLQCLAPKDKTSPYADFGALGPAQFPLLLYNVREGKEDCVLDTPSFYNLEECKAIVSIIQGLLGSKKIEDSGGINTGEIAVITPFRAQVLKLRTHLRLSGLGGINVGVVEDFQGQETSIVLISTVLTAPHKRWSREPKVNTVEAKLGFMHDPKRFNVAITRAHALCVVVGHAKYLEESGTYWTALIEHIQRNGGVVNSGVSFEESEDPACVDKEDASGAYGVRKLVERVEELKLLGSGYGEDRYDLAVYYEDTPRWKVMLT